MIGVAVKVTEVPKQMLVADAAIDMLTGNNGLTVMGMAFEVAGLPVLQVSLEVREQVITSPVTGI